MVGSPLSDASQLNAVPAALWRLRSACVPAPTLHECRTRWNVCADARLLDFTFRRRRRRVDSSLCSTASW